MTTVFISYSRRDDELFAKRLYKDLTQEGFEVWWDRESLHSVSLSFHQQIKDAIRAKIDRLIYIAGPNAAVSDYVREEWKFALECDKPVIPILRMGDYDAVPGELSLLHCDDFRDITKYPDQLKKLIANLRRPEPPLGHLFAVPTLPKHFMGRKAFLRRLKDAVQVDLQKPVVITGAASRVGVQGMGGIGKSVLAAAVARDREVRRAYPDGIIWVTFGQTPDIPQLMRDVAKHLGNPGAFENEVQGQGVLRELFLNRAVLLVFDDVWKAKDVQAFDVLGPRCRALVTTRDAGILHALHGELYSVELFSEEEALSLLAASAEQAADKLPKQARKIVKECGYLPLAVALCGGMAKKRGGKWESILKRLQRANLEKIADRESINEQHKNIWQA
ncbi:MAG: TIR domain-containing protein, partial [Deltaproteobacteria bacterium]|nr:TIR domain-containing protein [Deltaproteobacteria bacterium]